MFQISTRFRYGLRALVYITLKNESDRINLHEISINESISRKYLENIFKLLKKSKIIKSVRGREGGYALMKTPAEITLFEIASAIEGGVVLVNCVDNEGFCERTSECGVRNFWGDYQNYIKEYLSGITLADILEKYMKQGINRIL